MAPTQRSRLFTIPAEVRVRIYEYALISNAPIVIEKDEPQPNILRTCRQIRKEAMSIYYTENDFSMTIHQWDGLAAVPFRKLMLKYRTNNKVGNLVLDLCTGCDVVNFENLMKWTEAYHEDHENVVGLSQNKVRGHDSRAKTLARRVFGTVEAMRSEKWYEVFEVLIVFYDAIFALQQEDSDELADSEDESDSDEDEESESSGDESGESEGQSETS
ncbi:hypothetical protein LTR56_018077 [Elasticomyces elasticus]|nr:hypothetical protein LTR56_018077 [Elasticomyces elasticus]KAK3639523.1 hypothetical protein LTR22_017385 [Elasticomyces elasticus]KAK4913175.1 hypothetical protein LTR49_018449 [Elasticomyces elasticus]KAK5752757.1 hypothetical protein LTS12_017140 [Elasticomyces elasticus]